MSSVVRYTYHVHLILNNGTLVNSHVMSASFPAWQKRGWWFIGLWALGDSSGVTIFGRLSKKRDVSRDIVLSQFSSIFNAWWHCWVSVGFITPMFWLYVGWIPRRLAKVGRHCRAMSRPEVTVRTAIWCTSAARICLEILYMCEATWDDLGNTFFLGF